MRIISIHQPAYLPWLGYFHKIALADIFVFFNTTQFEKNSFINRNKIKTSHGPIWLSVPVSLKDHLQKEIQQIEIADKTWPIKHWKTIELNYVKAPYWPVYSPEIKKLYQKDYQTIDQICYDQLILFNKFLGIKTKIIKSSALPEFTSKKEELVLEILDELRADAYISGALGKEYIHSENFKKRHIRLYYQNYQHPAYQQLWSADFSPYMSVIDLLFNHGPKSFEILMSENVTQKDLQNNPKLYE